jgi:hypothetical protein
MPERTDVQTPENQEAICITFKQFEDQRLFDVLCGYLEFDNILREFGKTRIEGVNDLSSIDIFLVRIDSDRYKVVGIKFNSCKDNEYLMLYKYSEDRTLARFGLSNMRLNCNDEAGVRTRGDKDYR